MSTIRYKIKHVNINFLVKSLQPTVAWSRVLLETLTVNNYFITFDTTKCVSV
jgi:hypothetical protein